MLRRITHTDMQLSPTVMQRREIAQIVARESAETLVGRAAGLRVEVVRRLIRPVANLVASRFVTYDRAIGEAGMNLGSAWIVDEATGGLAIEGREQVPTRGPLLVGRTVVVPAAVRGVVSRSAFDHPRAKRRGVPKERQRMATLLQLAFSRYQANSVTIRFGQPIRGDARDVHAAVIEAMHALIGAA